MITPTFIGMGLLIILMSVDMTSAGAGAIVAGIVSALGTGATVSTVGTIQMTNKIQNWLCNYILDDTGDDFLNDGQWETGPSDIPKGAPGGFSAKWDWTYTGVDLMVGYKIGDYQLVIHNFNPAVGSKGFWFDIVPYSSTNLRDRYYEIICTYNGMNDGCHYYFKYSASRWTDYNQHVVSRYGLTVEARLGSTIPFTVKSTDTSGSCSSSAQANDEEIVDDTEQPDDVNKNGHDDWRVYQTAEYHAFRAGVLVALLCVVSCVVIIAVVKMIVNRKCMSMKGKVDADENDQVPQDVEAEQLLPGQQQE
mmetsp:Transcript_51031/g.84732  ORF Transcript_51031/g.84732 Transcript_51031/m.84732 type:complete len:307 (-) Transcript_51031:202-1122(-)|eukprot:CAMPEP_0202696210 /NCGR_PEP_ID=MMETSP1385-20130828/9516_1 /ASSEMBLY_ACC=CAM_ASM_000861 /TAXON_ID=933848 /ORGANISM="Elphidium margaritaceum" /LENGTH=306 /DNA_ID=CAMNT_0049352327 /DNA_START=60 /DNA_END=980 /DNA_ORIENTATION=+